MYQALARKYRPQSFSEVIGQESVLSALGNAIKLSRLHHAYLFCGARGVGKTSMARIFAKSVNCEKGPTLTPCQTCAACREITQGNSFDVIEIDAASHTGVDNIRELREQVKYLPANGRYKIYIIDEVHMLSTSAFNALLKTLEEPPAHIIFVLATTEPHEIPVTILSRCLRFDFRKLGKNTLMKHLSRILTEEHISAVEGALDLIAECAGGSVRDALSILDQIIGTHPEGLSEESVRRLLGLGSRVLLQNLAKNLIEGNREDALAIIAEADQEGLDFKNLGEDLCRLLRDVLITVATRKPPEELSPAQADFCRRMAAQTDETKISSQLQILFQTLNEIARSDFERTLFEVAVLKMTDVGSLLSLVELVEQLKQRATRPSGATAASTVSVPTSPSSSPSVSAEQMSVSQNRPANPIPLSSGNWFEFVRHLRTSKPNIASALADAVPILFTAEGVEISFPAGGTAKRIIIERRAVVEESLQEAFGRPVPLIISDMGDEKKKP